VIVPSSAEFKNDWRCISTPSVSLDRVYRDFFNYVKEGTVGLYRMLLIKRGIKNKYKFAACVNRRAAERSVPSGNADIRVYGVGR